MGKKTILLLLTFCLLTVAVCRGIDSEQGGVFTGQDLHLRGNDLFIGPPDNGDHTMVFDGCFSMSVGSNRFVSDSAVVWLEGVTTEFHGLVVVDYQVSAYLCGNVVVDKGRGGKTTDIDLYTESGEVCVGQAKGYQNLIVRFRVGGEVFVTADSREVRELGGIAVYDEGFEKVSAIGRGREFVVRSGAIVPQLDDNKQVVQKTWPEKEGVGKTGGEEFIAEAAAREDAIAKAKEPVFRYPVHLSPAGQEALDIESMRADDEVSIDTVIGRIYLWQKQDERGTLLELQADNTVVFRDPSGEKQTEGGELKGAVKAVYMSGDVLMTEGSRTFRADELYYDFEQSKALCINGVMRNFDVKRDIPIYIRASKIHQIAEDKFAAEDAVVTSSEFYKPQISFTVSEIIITDTTVKDAEVGEVSDSSYDAQMRDIRLKAGKATIFYWPFMRSNLELPDIPIKRASVGHDSVWGTSVETRWYMARILGLREPEGVESTLALDYFGKRGFGVGAEIDYNKEDYYGRMLGYIIRDSGKDRLGSNAFRKSVDPDRDIRGRFSLFHRQFLPYNWQLTTAVGYASDENFIEGYYRNEFNVGTEDTYLELKRSEDNWALVLLAKGRINNFSDVLTELPSGEFHLTGQSLFDGAATLYSDTKVGRMQQKIGDNHTINMSQERFTFVSHRTELDVPFQVDWLKVVPYVAGTVGYDDRSGFARSLVNGSNSGRPGDELIFIGEAGVRVNAKPWWRLYRSAKSRLWDINQLRHVISPYVTASIFGESDKSVKQRDSVHVGISQRLQTKRGVGQQQRTVDWMRLDTDVTWVRDSGPDTAGADQYLWAKPIIPLRVLSAPDIYNGDFANNLQRFEMYGPQRNYASFDYIWRVNDSSALLSDMVYDMQSGVVQQFNIGLSRMVWPNLSYYIGSRYLRRVQVLGENGTNAVTFAATYRLDSRYSLVFSQQYDFDYGANIRSDITLIRRYHRVFWSFTYSADETLDNNAIVFSIWPQGIPEMAIGERRYMDLGGSSGY